MRAKLYRWSQALNFKYEEASRQQQVPQEIKETFEAIARSAASLGLYQGAAPWESVEAQDSRYPLLQGKALIYSSVSSLWQLRAVHSQKHSQILRGDLGQDCAPQGQEEIQQSQRNSRLSDDWPRCFERLLCVDGEGHHYLQAHRTLTYVEDPNFARLL